MPGYICVVNLVEKKDFVDFALIATVNLEVESVV